MNIAVAFALAWTAGCSGESTDDGSTDDEPDVCEVDLPARSPLRRLTHDELDNTLQDLLGDDTRPATRLLPPERLGGFSNNVDVRTVDEATAAGYTALAQDVAARIGADPSALMGCDAAQTECVQGWLFGMLPRLWRRARVSDAQLGRLVDFYEAQRAAWGADLAVRQLLAVMLQSPDLLYRIEPTVLDAAPGEMRALTGVEVATRLSYFLWSTAPDALLWEAALAGQLDTAAGVAEHTRRMLEDPRAEDNVHRFFHEWMELDLLEGLEKDAEEYPDYYEGLTELWDLEVHAFVDEVWHRQGASYETLLTASWTVADAELAAFHGLSAPDGPGFSRVERDPEFHAGILTQGALLATRARAYESSPIHRGLFVRGPMLCQSMKVPDEFDVEAPTPDREATTREELEAHREDPVCYACHSLIDPPGLAFEHFDAVGRFRTHDGDSPVDASGELSGTDVDGPIDGVPQLAARLAQSDSGQRCFSRQWFRFAHGRRDAGTDACSVEQATEAFQAAELDMRQLVVATTTATAFRFAVGAAEEAGP
ncbi:MAG: DUF1592 domain-containing protein [Myxococcales bacterium]|nr:DUF1592 domain-containing protein [Myxococcales bacterium]